MQAATTSTVTAVTTASPVSMLLAMQSPGGRQSAFRLHAPTAPTKDRKRRSASEDNTGRPHDAFAGAIQDLRACAIAEYAKLVEQQPTSMTFGELAAHSRYYNRTNPIIKRMRDACSQDKSHEEPLDFGVPRDVVRNLFNSTSDNLFGEEDTELLEYEVHVPEYC